jgi:hypothetical protein
MCLEYSDYPKLHSPFIRKETSEGYFCTEEIDENEKWFLEDGVIAVDKIDGTNIAVLFHNNELYKVFNRTSEKRLLNKNSSNWSLACMEGIMTALSRNWCKNFENDKYYYGELVGPIVNGNRHKLNKHYWVPFEYLKEHCFWKSWSENKYPKTYKDIKEWFKELPSLFSMRINKGEKVLAEGLVFYHSDGRRCKLRRDMFDYGG